MNKRQSPPVPHEHTHEHGAQDNCEGCQAERRENNLLVDFYTRLNKIEGKVGQLKDGMAVQKSHAGAYRQKMQEMTLLLKNKPEDAIRMIKEHDSKEMGYELASALIEREIKTKMENQRLQGIIEQLQREKVVLQTEKKRNFSQENTRSIGETDRKVFPGGSGHKSRYSDAIDQVRNTNDSSYFIPKKRAKDMTNSYFQGDAGRNYWQDLTPGQDETNFSNFTGGDNKKEKSKSESKQTYQGLNLWLYQYKPEEIETTPIKSLRKPPYLRKIAEGNIDKGRSRANKV